MNRTIYIFVALVLIVALGWVNVYDYIPDSHHGLYRINRLTHQVDFDVNGDEWHAISEQKVSELLSDTEVFGGNRPGFTPLKE